MIPTLSRTLVIVLSLAAACGASAQEELLDNPQLAAARQLLRDSRESIIREELRLTTDEEAKFWPLYELYRADIQPLGDQYVALIIDYMRHYEAADLTNEFAEKAINRYFDIRQELLRVRRSYVSRFAAILPMLKVARFYQLETKMTADVDAELALLVPLIESE